MPKRTKAAKKTCIVIPILRTTSGGGAEKDNCSAETEKICAENAKIESAGKSAEMGGNQKIGNHKESESHKTPKSFEGIDGYLCSLSLRKS